ncbi:MAG: porin [Thiobacillus sp.]
MHVGQLCRASIGFIFLSEEKVMKKSLIALAVASAVSAPAFAATSNVDVYGVLNFAVASIDSDTANQERQLSLASQNSRIGFKGAEDLGGGLSAIWQIESSVFLDESGGPFATRNTFVGLKGGFGSVLLGRHDTPVKMLRGKVDNFGDTLADSRNLLGSNNATGSSSYDLRPNNTVVYMSPNLGGLTLVAAYSADHGINGAGVGTNTAAAFPGCDAGVDCNDRDAYSVSADYTNGPLLFGLGYERQNTVAVISSVNTDVDRSIWRAVAGFNIADFKLGAVYERASADDVFVGDDRNGWGLFANYALGNVVLKANYLTVGDYDGMNDSGAKQYTFGVDYNLSKRTTASLFYVQIKNDTNAGFDLGRAQGVSDSVGGTGITAADLGADPSAFGLGLKHTF